MRSFYILISLIALSSVEIARAEFLTCESMDERPHYCPADTRNGVNFVRKLSDADCSPGRSWNYDERGVWVSRGCRAVFDVHGVIDRRDLSYGPYGYDQPRDYRRGYFDRPPEPIIERCPAGFQPSENKCRPDERRHGCKDIRLPGGLGCVHR